MKTTRILCATLLAAALATGVAQAAGIDKLVGKTPGRLLKQEPVFAKAYRAALAGEDLPDWTKRLAVGFPTEAIELDGKKLILVSACNPKGCNDERMYALYEPADRSLTAFFFLPPDMSAPGDNRIAASRWLGKQPTKVHSDFLLERALKDALPETKLPADQPNN